MAENADQSRVLPQVFTLSQVQLTQLLLSRSPAHGNAYVLSFAFCFDKEDENYQFAMCQPFTYSRHKVRLTDCFIAANKLSGKS